MAEITDLLQRADAGDGAALGALMPLVYERLRLLARRQLARAEQGPRTLNTTALVHELYLDMQRRDGLPSAARGQFYSYAATAMRHILVDAARRRRAEKRGAGGIHVDSADVQLPVDAEAQDVLAIDQALAELQNKHPRLAQVIELRFFAGLAVEQVAELQERDPRSVVRDWRKARLLLHRSLSGG